MVVEADGGQHLNNAADARRTAWLAARGWRVVRFWNNDILTNLDGVLTSIVSELQKPSPSRR